jgi:hypothetical protein
LSTTTAPAAARDGAHARFINCEFKQNGQVGANADDDDCSSLFSNCTFSENGATGITAGDRGAPKLIGCTIGAHTRAGIMVNGTGVRAEDTEITDSGCTVISVADGSEATFVHCFVRGAGQFGGRGGSVANWEEAK